ncbi:reverse transcriptase [Plakobranchus ocellatus]|uniref:Reverse transcriptase n=1 Tax=Plakobranchus ocellatus TaxID=259542 RepID=A0AAV4CVK4_9GAST|nr:reverse transcriptase [Plakobranchus ocellatus]
MAATRNRVLQELAIKICDAKDLLHQPKIKALVFTSDVGTKSWCGSAGGMDTQRKSFLDEFDEFSADLPESNKHPKVIQDTGMRLDILIHSSATRQTIMVELTVPYESRMKEANTY